jgi:MYXO-CTERM domain-containing protein
MRGLLRGLAATALFLPALSAHGTVLAYYRFEDGAFLADSSGGGHDLSQSGTLSQLAIPATGNGSDFSNPIPQTAALNGHLVNNGATGTGHFTASDSTGWLNSIAANDTFTLEALVNLQGTYSETVYIVSQWTATTGNRSFAFGVNSSEQLSLTVSTTGANGLTFGSNSSFQLDLNTDYYVAVSFDASNVDSGLTFYIKNLSVEGSALVSQTFLHNAGSVNNSGASLFVGTYNSDVDRRFNGYFDEVRISDTVLGESELLISVPEPGAGLLALAALGAFAGLRRRRQPARLG